MRGARSKADQPRPREGADYYLQPSEDGGEPPGRWWGPGAAALGLQAGQVVERGTYELLFGQRKAPDGSRLGRPPSAGPTVMDVYGRLLAAEPHATMERKRELLAEAAGRTRTSPLYFVLVTPRSQVVRQVPGNRW